MYVLKNIVLLKVLPILGIVLFWQFLVVSHWVDALLFPSPIQVASALALMFAEGHFGADILISIFRVFFGFLLASIAGVTTGMITGHYMRINKSLGQVLNLLRAIPPIAIVPLVIIWFGLGEFSKIFVVFWGVFFPIWINTHIGVTSINQEYIWVAKSLGARPRAIFWEVVLPGAVTSILGGMRTGIAIAFICLVAAEMTGADKGIGYRITISHLTFRIDQMIGAIIVLGILGMLADNLFVKICNKLFPWYRNTKTSR